MIRCERMPRDTRQPTEPETDPDANKPAKLHGNPAGVGERYGGGLIVLSV
jgi:hypothetical protein